MAESRRTFTREFKVAAVKLVTEKGRSVSEAARSLGISAEILRRWKVAFAAEGPEAFPGHGNLPPPTRKFVASKPRSNASKLNATF